MGVKAWVPAYYRSPHLSPATFWLALFSQTSAYWKVLVVPVDDNSSDADCLGQPWRTEGVNPWEVCLQQGLEEDENDVNSSAPKFPSLTVVP